MTAAAERAAEPVLLEKGPILDVLLVSEDPAFVADMQRALRERGGRVIACLGPAQTPCNLDCAGICPLAGHCSVAVVDTPVTGVFSRHWRMIPAGAYAARLQRAHPDTFVVLIGAPEGPAGPTGEVTCVADREAGMEMLGWLTTSHPSRMRVFTEARRASAGP